MAIAMPGISILDKESMDPLSQDKNIPYHDQLYCSLAGPKKHNLVKYDIITLVS